MTSDKLFIPNTNPLGLQYRTSNFPSGESYVKLMTPGKVSHYVDIFYRWTGDSSLIQLFNLTNALRLKGAGIIDLYCPYFPGCRSDRVGPKNEGEALSSKVYAQLVNSQMYNSVAIFDPHSDVTPAVLERVRVVNNHDFVRSVLKDFHNDYLFICPDAGANKKVFDLAEAIGGNHLVIRADKKRDVGTGALIPGSCTVFATEDEIKGKTCVIVDDICSRGGTFKTLAKELKTLGASTVILIVSHYEGVADESEMLESGISMIFTTTSLIEPRLHGSYINTTDIYKFIA